MDIYFNFLAKQIGIVLIWIIKTLGTQIGIRASKKRDEQMTYSTNLPFE